MKIKKRTQSGQEFITVEELQEKIDQGNFGMLTFFGGYFIDEDYFFAHGLTLYPKETKIRAAEDEKSLFATVYFKEMFLPLRFSTGNPQKLVQVEVEIKNLDSLFVSLAE